MSALLRAPVLAASALAARVLVVVDMERDYCPDCVPPTAHPYENPFLSKTLAVPTARNITQLMQQMDFELTVFTKDWGEPDWEYLVPNTPGTDIIPWLFSSARGPTQNFTKDVYDWLNDKPGHHAKNGEGAPLGRLLSQWGLGPDKASMVVVGLATNLCVFNGAVHAAQLGYNVTVFRDAMVGPPESYKWVVGANGSRCPHASNLTHGIPCAPPADRMAPDCQFGANCSDIAAYREWILSVQGGPSTEEAFSYMEAAGIRVLPSFLQHEDHRDAVLLV